jgi:hypothetical protein
MEVAAIIVLGEEARFSVVSTLDDVERDVG